MNELIKKIEALPDGDQYIDEVLSTITLDDLKALAAAVPRWVPCEERLPEKEGNYLVTGAYGWVGINYYHPDYGMGNAVTAWQELPAPYAATNGPQVERAEEVGNE